MQGISRKVGAHLSDMNVLIAEEAKSYYEKHFRKKRNVVIYNPADEKLFDKETCYKKESRKLISVGRLTYQKNYHRLLEIADKLLKNNNEWTWHIYGDGEDREELEAIIVEKGLVDKVTKASICSVTRIVPISAAIAAPIRPATIKAERTGANSLVTEIKTTCATVLSAPKLANPE